MSHPIRVPLIDVTTQNQELRREIDEAIARVIDTSAFILGPEVKSFEEEFQQYTKVPFAVSCASGSDALLLPLMAIGVGPGDEVLVPSFTFYATAGAVARLGATPIFVDSDETYNICLKDMAAKITSKTKAVIPVHLFGQMTDMEKLLTVTKPAKLAVIEDCAQSIGAELRGKTCGSFGDFGAFSFYPTKNLGAIGDAGMMSALTRELNDKLKMIRVHGSNTRYYHELIGVNSRLDSIQAAVLRVKLRRLKQYEEKREAHARLYTELFKNNGSSSKIRLPVVAPERKHVWNQYTIRVENRDALRAFLTDRQISTEIYYPLAMHRQEAFGVKGKISLPLCEALEREVLSLPMFPELKREQIEWVANSIRDFFVR